MIKGEEVKASSGSAEYPTLHAVRVAQQCFVQGEAQPLAVTEAACPLPAAPTGFRRQRVESPVAT